MPAMRLKLFFPEIFGYSVIFKEILIENPDLKILIITNVCFSNACSIHQNARAEQSTEHAVRQLC